MAQHLNVKNFDVRDIDDKTIEVLYRLGLNDKIMYNDLLQVRGSRSPRRNSRVFIIEEDGEVIAWGLAFVRRYIDTHNMVASIGVYVKKSYRRLGFGKLVIGEMVKWIGKNTRAKEIIAQPHDEKSSRAFCSCGICPDSKRRAAYKLNLRDIII